MKKTIVAILSVLTACLTFAACENLPFLNDLIGGSSSTEQGSLEETSSSVLVQDTASESISSEEDMDSSAEESSTSESSDSSAETDKYAYTAFTPSEKAKFIEYIGEVIPFAPNNEYYVEEYELDWETEYEVGLNFYTYGNTQAEFNAYKALFADYTFAGSEADEYGDMWYYFDKDDFYIDMAYYSDGENYIIDVYAYCLYDSDPTPDEGGNEGGNEGGAETTDIELLTNAGKGLPTSANGVYNVDFTKATNVKNVTDQGYYLDGCPTVSTETTNPAVLVIPVEFSDVTAASKGYTVDKIEKAFNGSEADATYYSVWEYYYLSSYGKLDLDITVLDSWFKPKYASAYYAEATDDYGEWNGDQLIIDEALAALAPTMDLSKYDSDGNTVIDAVVLINTLEIGEDNFHWAYRYWNTYVDDEGYYYEYDGVSANDYLWASYQFMMETYDEEGNAIYDSSVMNTYTYIHEFGHVLGADDYYDTAYVGSPMGGCDIMDSMFGDHNPYTKFHYGWLTTSKLVVAEESVTLTLEDFSKNGDTIIIANNWDESLGAYQEYYIVMYYTNTELNSETMGCGYFLRDGIVVYHVNASLYKEVYEGETYYDVYNNNTDVSEENGYGTEDNLIEYVKSPADTYTYVVGDSLSNSIVDDQGNTISYTFTVDSITEDTATLTFTKNN